MTDSALAMWRLLRDLGVCVALYRAALAGLLALALLVGRDAGPGRQWGVHLGMPAAGLALEPAWPSSRARVWRGLRAVGETLCGLALMLGLWVGMLVAWAGHHVRADARREGRRRDGSA